MTKLPPFLIYAITIYFTVLNVLLLMVLVVEVARLQGVPGFWRRTFSHCNIICYRYYSSKL